MKKLTLLFASVMMMACLTVQAAGNVNLSTLTADYTVPNNAMTVSGTLNNDVKITVPTSVAKIQFYNCNIPGSASQGGAHAGIVFKANGTYELDLVGDNYVAGYDYRYPGIYVEQGAKLTIKSSSGTGTLTAECKGGTSSSLAGAGIGGGENMNAGAITITSGTVTAKGGTYGAGIGAGKNATCGDINILRTVTKVTATRGSSAWCSVGPASSGKLCSYCEVGGLERKTGDNYGIVKQNYTYEPWTGEVDAIATLDDDVVAFDGMTIYGMIYSGLRRIYIASGASVYLDGCEITNTNGGAGLNCLGDATIILKGTTPAKVTGASNYPGIYVPQNKTLTIQAKSGITVDDWTGALKVFGGEKAAGIGAGHNSLGAGPCGNIYLPQTAWCRTLLQTSATCL